MKIMTGLRAFTAICMLTAAPTVASAAFSSGSTGVDGDFNPTANTVLQLPANGTFNFGTVNIPAGVTVTFKKNATNTPVTILVSGDVIISGTINVSGDNASTNLPGAGGPGGFAGGYGGPANTLGFRGQGPGGGGGGLGLWLGASGGGGGFGGSGNNGNLCANSYVVSSGFYCQSSGNGFGGASYGNDSLVPLIGGSGGGGASGVSAPSGAGGGGGGAILIASSKTIVVDGTIIGNGGNGSFYNSFNSGNNYFLAGGGGSGGAIRLVAGTSITGNGTISAMGGGSSFGGTYTYYGGNGGVGRIRIEAGTISLTANTTPQYSQNPYPLALYPSAVPTLTITQVATQAGTIIPAPAVPAGAFRSPDVTLPFNTSGPVTVTVSAQNVPVGKTVTIKALPESGNAILTATGTLSGTDTQSSVAIPITLSSGTAYILSASVNF